MVFGDYCNKIKNILARTHRDVSIVDYNMEQIFEAYINDTPASKVIEKLYKSMNEATADTDFLKYKNRVHTILEKLGYDKSELDNKKVTDTISDLYDTNEDEYACAEICKNEIDKAQELKPIKLTSRQVQHVRNNLIIALHPVSNAALLDLNVSPQGAVVKIKVRLTQGLQELHTDAKSYIKEVHKYLRAFLLQNSNTDVDFKVKSYSIKFNNLYCTSEFFIPFKDADGIPIQMFNVYDIARIIKSPLNVLETYSEQYRNIIK